jgi:hypothetical protein
MQDSNSYISSGTPTYWPTDPAKTPDLLDFFVAKGISAAYTTDIEPNFELSSDHHTPIIRTISSSVITRLQDYTTIKPTGKNTEEITNKSHATSPLLFNPHLHWNHKQVPTI